jgi:hypothetical protein
MMNKKELLDILLADIEELRLITESMQHLQSIPEVMQRLAIRKAESISAGLEKINNFQEENIDIKVKSTDIIQNNIPAIKEVDNVLPEEIQNNTLEEKNILSKQEFSEGKETIEKNTIISNDLTEATGKNTQEELKGTVIAYEKTITERKITNEKFNSQSTKRVGNKLFVQNLKKAINLNDRYRYQRELFGGDPELMNSIIDTLDKMNSLHEAMEYIQNEFDWDEQSQTVADFYSLLESRF